MALQRPIDERECWKLHVAYARLRTGLERGGIGTVAKLNSVELATARSRTVQVAPIVSEASRVAKKFVSLAASLPKMKKLQPSPVSLFYDLRRTVVTFARRTAAS